MNNKTKKIVGIGLLTAIVAVLQFTSMGVKFGPFSITLALTPIIVGAALYGWIVGAWLGVIMGAITIMDAALFLPVSVPATVFTCIFKATIAGLVAGLVYSALKKVNNYVAVLVAAISAPIVNTGIFLLACRVFFYATIQELTVENGFSNVVAFMFLGLVGVNFLVELIVNVVLSTVVARIINIGKKTLL